MPRQARHPADNGIYHVLNRGNCRMDIFTKPGDFQAAVVVSVFAICKNDLGGHLVIDPVHSGTY